MSNRITFMETVISSSLFAIPVICHVNGFGAQSIVIAIVCAVVGSVVGKLFRVIK